jgi:ribonuclease PH
MIPILSGTTKKKLGKKKLGVESWGSKAKGRNTNFKRQRKKAKGQKEQEIRRKESASLDQVVTLSHLVTTRIKLF